MAASLAWPPSESHGEGGTANQSSSTPAPTPMGWPTPNEGKKKPRPGVWPKRHSELTPPPLPRVPPSRPRRPPTSPLCALPSLLDMTTTQAGITPHAHISLHGAAGRFNPPCSCQAPEDWPNTHITQRAIVSLRGEEGRVGGGERGEDNPDIQREFQPDNTLACLGKVQPGKFGGSVLYCTEEEHNIFLSLRRGSAKDPTNSLNFLFPQKCA